MTLLLWPQVRPEDETVIIDRVVASGWRHGLETFDLGGCAFTSSGGKRVGATEIAKLRQAVVEKLAPLGFSSFRAPVVEARRMDRAIVAAIHENLSLSIGEASIEGVWVFLAGVVFPDVINWRWNGEAATYRIEAGRRNATYSWWMQGQVLHQAGADDPWHVLDSLGVDNVVQMIERPFLAGARHAANALAKEIASALKSGNRTDSQAFVRDAMARAYRSAALLAVRSLTADESAEWASEVVGATAIALTREVD